MPTHGYCDNLETVWSKTAEDLRGLCHLLETHVEQEDLWGAVILK